MTEIIEINLCAPINRLSYGIVGYNILKELRNRDIRVNLFPIGHIDCEASWVDDIKWAVTNQDDFHPTAPSLRIFHQFSLAEHVGKGKHVGFPIFELDTFTAREVHHMAYCDELCVPSEWAKDIVSIELNPHVPPEFTEKHTHVVPLGVDHSVFFPAVSPPKDKFIFLNIGKWEKRKGHDVLLQAFNEEFKPEDNVELWMLAANMFVDNTPWIKQYKSCKLKDKIVLLDRIENQAQVAETMNYADCGVFPSRAEGWNLPLLEMMACGKPTITTNCTAHTEFCTAESNVLIDMKDVEPAFEEPFFRGQGNWWQFGTFQITKLKGYMRDIYTHKDNYKNCASKARLRASQFTWSNTVDKLLWACS